MQSKKGTEIKVTIIVVDHDARCVEDGLCRRRRRRRCRLNWEEFCRYLYDGVLITEVEATRNIYCYLALALAG